MRITDLEKLLMEIHGLRGDLDREMELRRKAEAGWSAMCELLGERMKIEEEHEHCHIRVKAEAVLGMGLLIATDTNLDELTGYLPNTLAHAIFLQLRAGREGRLSFERAAVPRMLRELPVPEIPKTRMPDPEIPGRETPE
jgi:hypothetical protein